MNSTAIKRIVDTSKKQVQRSGWIGWASISIMTLALIVLSIFLLVAFVSELFLQSLENKPHIYIFFKTGVEDSSIVNLQNTIEQQDNVTYVEYTSEEQAKDEFIRFNQANNNPLIAQEVEERSLPASLAIRLNNLQDAKRMIDFVEDEAERNDDIFAVRYSQQTIDNIRDVVFWLRIAGGLVMLLLIVVIILFTLLTVEFRTYSRSKEIQIMQLVGGSLWYIRMPFILEGGFYGVVGAFISNIILIIIGIFTWYSQATSSTKSFILNIFGDLQWPTITLPGYITLFILTLLIGFLIGAFNSLIAIRRYIR